MNTALFDRLSAVQADLVVTLVPSEAALPQSTSWVDENTAGLISQLRESKVFSGKLAETLLLPVASQDYAQAVLLVGIGKDESLSDASARKVMAAVAAQVKSLPYASLAFAGAELVIKDHSASQVLSLVSQWLHEGFYQFTGFKKEDPVIALESVLFEGSDQAALDVGVATATGSAMARRRGDLPGNV